MAHPLEALLVDQVYDQLDLVQCLKVGDLGLVPGFHQRLKARLDQVRHAAAKNGLLPKEIRFCLLLEGRFQHARTGAADAARVGEGEVTGIAARVLSHRKDAGHPRPVHVHAAQHVARPLGRHQEHIHVGGRLDAPKVDVEAVPEGEGLARRQVRGDALLVHLGLRFVGDQQHDHVRFPGRVLDARHAQARLLGLGTAGAALAEANHHVQPAVAQVLRVRVRLGAVADDGDQLVLDGREAHVAVVVHLCGHWRILLQIVS